MTSLVCTLGMGVLRVGTKKIVFYVQDQGKKKEPKPKLFGPDIFQWGRGLPRERVGAKKFK